VDFAMPLFLRALVLLCFFFVWAGPASAGSIGDVLLPGDLIQGHAKIESECTKCHKKFDKAAQPTLCKECHKEVGKDFEEKRGFHGRIKEEKECKECHTDHKGRKAHIVIFNPDKFDHTQTDFQLKGKHLDEKIKCKDCHPSGKKYREAPTACNGCHKKDDKHKGGLGTDCAKCHVEKDWKTTSFDHNKTDYPLVGKHVDVKCISCHINGKYKDTSKQCSSCHQKDDKHKGKFGSKCETCHAEKGWKEIQFNHDKDTKYPLQWKHRDVKCVSCHKGDLYKDRLKTNCESCHKKDDDKAHKGSFGQKCETCHAEKGWKEIQFNHDKDTKYPLQWKHRDVKCVSCHKGDLYKDKLQNNCYACHEKDDKHKGQEGKKCESCHTEESWNKAKFDHRNSHFPLTGKHISVECKKCHAAATFKDAKSDCWSCHEKQDAHKRRLGTACEVCHNTRDWKVWDFDHDKTQFKLDGGHKKVDCYKCHREPVSGKVSLSGACISCHDKDDEHSGNFGSQCERCHSTSSWKDIRMGGRTLR
jgi:hypothetical protein